MFYAVFNVEKSIFFSILLIYQFFSTRFCCLAKVVPRSSAIMNKLITLPCTVNHFLRLVASFIRVISSSFSFTCLKSS